MHIHVYIYENMNFLVYLIFVYLGILLIHTNVVEEEVVANLNHFKFSKI